VLWLGRAMEEASVEEVVVDEALDAEMGDVELSASTTRIQTIKGAEL
jgi:hypothetical protein